MDEALEDRVSEDRIAEPEALRIEARSVRSTRSKLAVVAPECRDREVRPSPSDAYSMEGYRSRWGSSPQGPVNPGVEGCPGATTDETNASSSSSRRCSKALR